MNRRQRSRFPSLQSRGGHAIKKNDAEGHQSWRGRDGQSSKRVWNAVRDISSEMTTHFLDGAATPPVPPCYVPHLLLDTGALKTTGGKAEVPSSNHPGRAFKGMGPFT